jgi:fructoselysine-6-P-deglycase FrlB-like protein
VGSIDKQRRRLSRSTSLDLMEEEIRSQVEELRVFAPEIGKQNDHQAPPSDMVFTGSGDSLASSLFASYLSRGQACAADPFELQLTPELTRDKTVFITSVSGRTRANVQLARRIRRLARARIAVTANPVSPLAKECDETLQLPSRSLRAVTSGTVSFTMSLLAVASRVRPLPTLRDLDKAEAQAKKWAHHVSITPQGGFLFVGSGIGYALSAYGASKIHEVLGQPADHVRTEQLGHSKLFALQTNDNIVCLATRRDRKTPDVSRTLSKNGFHSDLLDVEASDPVLAGLEAAFSFQHLALNLARARGLRECAFLMDKQRLRLSSSLIY